MRVTKAIICLLSLMIVATPCILEISSTEPPPVTALVDLALNS